MFVVVNVVKSVFGHVVLRLIFGMCPLIIPSSSLPGSTPGPNIYDLA